MPNAYGYAFPSHFEKQRLRLSPVAARVRTLKVEEGLVGKVVMYSSVSVDGFIADENDQPGPLFHWLLSGDVPLDESGVLKVSQTSYDYIRPYWDQIGATIVGRHVFDMTNGWDGTPPAGVDHVVVVNPSRQARGLVSRGAVLLRRRH
jgi:hypothetical protein